MDEQLAALKQMLLNDGWITVVIEPGGSPDLRILTCKRYSPLVGDEYIASQGLFLDWMQGDADIQAHIVRQFHEEYKLTVSNTVDERWTVAPLRITVGEEAATLGRDALESKRLAADPRERWRDYGNEER